MIDSTSRSRVAIGRHPIVVAVGRSGGTAAIRTALALAARDDSDVIVLSVVEPPSPVERLARRALRPDQWLVEEEIEERRRHLQERLDRFSALSSRRLRPPAVEVMQGDPPLVIARVARERQARLIVMGVGPFAVSRRLVAEGTAWSTSRRAPCPVLAVTERLHELPRVVVAATDFSPESIHAAIEALPLVAEGAVVHLVHAWRRIEGPAQVAEIDAANRAYATSIPRNFARMRSLLGPGYAVRLDTVVREGLPAESVLAVARQERADLIVVGTHGLGLMERWLLGSTSTAILRGAECSILLVPPPPVAEHSRLARHMTGSSAVRQPEQWNEELQAFVQRNQHRRTTLEIDDSSIGAQVQESGYALVGATYDPHDRHLALMFGEGAERGAHLTRSLGDVRSVAVASDAREADRALCIESANGSAILTFLDPPASAAAGSRA